MRFACRIVGAAMTLAATNSIAASAQSAPSVGIEVTSDEVRRGLSWSDRRAAGSGDVALRLGPLDASARIVTLRGSARHDGADAVADIALGTAWDLGAVRLRTAATTHVFAGARTRMDYVELGGSGSFTYGPVQLTAGAEFAPAQHAIGGSNLYVYASANAGIPGTPLTVIADLGHASGTVDDRLRAQRLRPGGDYTDWRLAIEHQRGPVTLAIDYVGTDIDRNAAFGPFADRRPGSDQLLLRARFNL